MGLIAVGSCKIGKKLNTFLPQKERSRTQLTLKTKARQNEVWQCEGQCPTSGTHSLLGSQGLSSSCSVALPSTAHIACLTGSGGLYSTAAAAVSGPPVVLASQTCWCFLWSWAAPSPKTSWALFRDLTHPSSSS